MNYAFIDSQNLILGMQRLGWKIDYKKLQVYLKEKYRVKKTYWFVLTSDGDFYSLVHHLYVNEKLESVWSPYKKECSWILQRAAREKIQFITDLKDKLEHIPYAKKGSSERQNIQTDPFI